MKLVGIRFLVGLLFFGLTLPSHAQQDVLPVEFVGGISYRNFQFNREGKWDINAFHPVINFSISTYIRPQLDMALQVGANLLQLADSGTPEANSEIDWTLRYSPLKLPQNKAFRILNPYIIGGMGSTIRGKGPRELNFHIPMGMGIAIRPTRGSVVQIQAVYKLSEIQDYVSVVGGVGIRLGKPKPKDRDEDGIPDKEDHCPLVPGVVAFQGCADTDKDGVPDTEDSCPLIAGLLEDLGCPPPPPDSDRDGVIDAEDICPSIPGSPSAGGCPDADGDGIYDEKDECPDFKGKASLKGCPDRDNDGVPDKIDACPEKIGDFTTGGCPDADQDGVRDIDDECPVDVGPPDNKGCPLIKTRGEEELEFYAENVKFESGSVLLTKATQHVLKEVARILDTYSSFRLDIIGHTDASGDKNKNQILSQKRAEACMDHLISLGIKASRISAKGLGESQPIADNDTPEGREKNRRVEFSLHSN